MSKKKTYLGDSVYAEFDNHNIILTTNNGMEDSNIIYLDAETTNKLTDFITEVASEQ